MRRKQNENNKNGMNLDFRCIRNDVFVFLMLSIRAEMHREL